MGAINRGIHEFTVQEATNYEAFKDWNYEELDLNDSSPDSETSTYITSANPAKKAVLYDATGADGSTFDATDVLTITLNGESGTGKPILIDRDNLPFTISGLTLTSLAVSNSAGDNNNALVVLSFH